MIRFDMTVTDENTPKPSKEKLRHILSKFHITVVFKQRNQKRSLPGKMFYNALLGLALLSSQTPKTVISGFTLTSSSSHNPRRIIALDATVEKTSLISPDSLPSDDIPALFEDYVQKTYG